jgi:hypothetical protein
MSFPMNGHVSVFRQSEMFWPIFVSCPSALVIEVTNPSADAMAMADCIVLLFLQTLLPIEI